MLAVGTLSLNFLQMLLLINWIHQETNKKTACWGYEHAMKVVFYTTSHFTFSQPARRQFPPRAKRSLQTPFIAAFILLLLTRP
jgi:hypothetical protein